MSLSSWRNFPFFDCTPVRDPLFGSDSPLYSDSTLSAVCSSQDRFIIAVSNTLIKVIDKSFQLDFEFTAYELGWSVVKLKYIESYGLLCTIAEKQGQPLTLKLWSLNKIRKIVNNGPNNYPMTAFDCVKDFSVLAFGFGNGAAILVRGDLVNDRGSRQRVVYESKDPVTGVIFRDESLLYITTTLKVLTIPTTGANNGKPDRILEKNVGVDMGCTALSKDNKRHLLAGRDDALTFYSSKGATYSILLDLPKKSMHALTSKYIVFVSPMHSNLLASSNGSQYHTTKIVIVDIVNRFISFSQTVTSSVDQVFDMWGDLWAIGTDGMLYKFHEKALSEKLNILVQKDLFSIAIRLAENADPEEKLGLDDKLVLQIKKKFGDYLYEKDESMEAIEQYIQCFSLGKTSEIIQKYKDGSKIPGLIRYLEKMVEEKYAGKDHVTLLLCCYCKLKKIDEIINFIREIEIIDGEVTSPNYEFDLDTVLSLCRESGYLQLAAIIAKKFGEASIVVDIQLRDLGDAQAALAYMKTLSIEELLRVLVDNVSELLDKESNQTTALLINVFTGQYIPKPSSGFDTGELALLSSTEGDTKDTVPHPNEPENGEYPVLQSYRAFVSYMGSLGGDNESVIRTVETVKPTYLPPRPRIIFPSFVKHPNEFVIFLEACVEKYDALGGNEGDKKDILTTLFEMYLTLANSAESEDVEKAQWEKKAKDLGEREKNSVDPTSILLLSNLHSFNEGEIIARDEPGFEVDLFRSRMASGDINGSLAVLAKYGESDPELYRLALSYIVSEKHIFEAIGEKKFQEVLDKIMQLKLMTPLDVVQTLSMNSAATIGLIKNYLLQYVNSQRQEIQNNEKLAQSYREETARAKLEINRLITEPTTVQNTKCNSCGLKLDFPTVHFICKHSYHERCLGNESASSNGNGNGNASSEGYAHSCVAELEAITALRQAQEEVGERNNLFKAALSDASDRFKVMTSFYGRGAMESVRLVFDTPEE
ncbi:unnamed protein product [Kuraishia capsulata CBS 1993]|uniref:E3 ubiquitin-protein ligase PEP5 n=1 Tax=Kuraishia capsulata CBS 1993 TaxID=1382522 RepID=W6MPA9_9ASCO|nr:uncharacterized protein KUCA_T00002919001 [Kuraishia capsulata CBS 1993]CDK26942.1 unnamed protein product [Kuraishia capsulata CBS 1993]